MTESGFNKLELAILEFVKRTYADDALSAQFDSAKMINREYTGHGFFVDIEVPKSLSQIEARTLNERTVLTGPIIQTNELKRGGWCHVFVTNGYVDCLEIYALDDSFPEELESFELSAWKPGSTWGRFKRMIGLN